MLCHAALQYVIHKVEVTVKGLPEEERFMTTEQRRDGIMENHWIWTSAIKCLAS